MSNSPLFSCSSQKFEDFGTISSIITDYPCRHIFVAEDPIPKCPRVKKPKDAKMIGKGRLAGDTISFKCKKRAPFAIAGDSEITCGFDGQWSGKPLVCSCKWGPLNFFLPPQIMQMHIFFSLPISLTLIY